MTGKKTVYETEKEVSMIPHTDVQVEDIGFILKNPRLWNGMQDPFMYQAVLTLIKDGKELDKVEQPLGLRYYVTDPDKGFS
jgi:domain.